jgi:hypothetical protein
MQSVPPAGPKGVAAPRPFSASFAGNRRGGGCETAKFSYPQPLETARNGEGVSRWRSGERGVRLQRFHPFGSAEAGANSQ